MKAKKSDAISSSRPIAFFVSGLGRKECREGAIEDRHTMKRQIVDRRIEAARASWPSSNVESSNCIRSTGRRLSQSDESIVCFEKKRLTGRRRVPSLRSGDE